jgi:hypothetical protein
LDDDAEDMFMTRLSDTEVKVETYDSEGEKSDDDNATDSTSDGLSFVGCDSEASGELDIRVGSDEIKRPEEFGEAGDGHKSAAALEREIHRLASENARLVEQNRLLEIHRLASENARLAEQNRLLSERCEFANMAVSAYGAPAVSFSELPPVGGPSEKQTAGASTWWPATERFQLQNGFSMLCGTVDQQEQQLQVTQQPVTGSNYPLLQQVPESGHIQKHQVRRQTNSERAGAEKSQSNDCALACVGEQFNDSLSEGSLTGDDARSVDVRTTVMLRNLPNNYTRSMLLTLLDGEGFNAQYDFLYLPMDFNTRACLGYAFVNLTSPECAQRFWAKFDGYSHWSIPSKKHCFVSWSNPHQGLDSNFARYRNSPVMHEAVPDEYRPIYFVNGKPAPFPEATKKIRAPRIKNYFSQSSTGHGPVIT